MDQEPRDIRHHVGPRARARDDKKNRALIGAVRDARGQDVVDLLNRGADVSTKDKYGNDVLFYSIEGFNVALTMLLLMYGADPNVCNSGGLSVLESSIMTGQQTMVSVLICAGARVGSVSALHMAARLSPLRQQVMAELFLQNDRAGHVRFHARMGRPIPDDPDGIIPLLLLHGADVNASNYQGLTPMMIAGRHNYVENMEELLAHPDIPVDATVPIFGRTALSSAASAGSNEAVALLLRNGADSKVKNTNGETALHLAVKKGMASSVQILLDHDIRLVLDTDSTGRSVFHMVPCIETVRVLFNYLRDDEDTKKRMIRGHGGPDNTSPLCEAVMHGRTDVVHKLVPYSTKLQILQAQALLPGAPWMAFPSGTRLAIHHILFNSLVVRGDGWGCLRK